MKKAVAPPYYASMFPSLHVLSQKHFTITEKKDTMKFEQSAHEEKPLRLTNLPSIEEKEYVDEQMVVIRLYEDSNSCWMEVFNNEEKIFMLETTRSQISSMSQCLKQKIRDWEEEENEEMYLTPEDLDENSEDTETSA